MNILIGKTGRSVYFRTDQQGFASGDEEAPNVYTLLAKRYPHHNFYFCGRSDITSIRSKAMAKTEGPSLFEDEEFVDPIPSNIIDLFKGYSTKSGILPHRWIEEQLKTIHLDVGIIYHGPSGNVNVPDMGTPRLDGSGDAKLLVMLANYAGPIIHALNITGVPYIALCGDPKYIPSKPRDVFNDERVVLTQCNGEYSTKRIVSYTDHTHRFPTIKFEYSGIETNFLLTESKIDFRNLEKTNQFIIGLHGGFSRDDFAREWLLTSDRIDSMKVYGEWSDEFTKPYPNVFVNKSIKSVESEFLNTRYTIIPPPHKVISKFVTQKFWKMIHYGIIPFFHPNYDTDKIFKVPDFLRIKSPTELWARIKILDSNPIAYKKMLNHIYNMLDDSYYSGDFLVNKISDSLKTHTNIAL